jgi:hypothetical protein
LEPGNTGSPFPSQARHTRVGPPARPAHRGNALVPALAVGGGGGMAMGVGGWVGAARAGEHACSKPARSRGEGTDHDSMLAASDNRTTPCARAGRGATGEASSCRPPSGSKRSDIQTLRQSVWL